jgi:hypothetical protein
MKNSSNTNGYRNRNLPVCSAVIQPTASPRTASVSVRLEKYKRKTLKVLHSTLVTANIHPVLQTRLFIPVS